MYNFQKNIIHEHIVLTLSLKEVENKNPGNLWKLHLNLLRTVLYYLEYFLTRLWSYTRDQIYYTITFNWIHIY